MVLISSINICVMFTTRLSVKLLRHEPCHMSRERPYEWRWSLRRRRRWLRTRAQGSGTRRRWTVCLPASGTPQRCGRPGTPARSAGGNKREYKPWCAMKFAIGKTKSDLNISGFSQERWGETYTIIHDWCDRLLDTTIDKERIYEVFC